jgi:TPR repeat protein
MNGYRDRLSCGYRIVLRLLSWRINPFRLLSRRPQKQSSGEPLPLGAIQNLSSEDWQAALSKSPEEAARYVHAAASYGNIDAQLNWAQMQLEGYGTRRDPEAAFRWFGIAALSKRADAVNLLGRCYDLGWGTPVDFAKAVECYREAADKSYDWAQYNLGCRLLDGRDVGRDPETAFTMFSKAVAQGHMKSLNMLGRCYENGWGCRQDMTEAILWYRRSAEAGDFRGQYRYGQLLLDRGLLDDAIPLLHLAIDNTPVEMCGDIAIAFADQSDPRLQDIAAHARARATGA